jgi:hypothetical protein
MNLSNTFPEFLENYTVKRSGIGQYINGEYIENIENYITISACIQPYESFFTTQDKQDIKLKSKNLEGDIYIFTDTKLNVTDSNTKRTPDSILYNNKEYEIRVESEYQNKLDFSYYEYVGCLKNNI